LSENAIVRYRDRFYFSRFFLRAATACSGKKCIDVAA